MLDKELLRKNAQTLIDDDGLGFDIPMKVITAQKQLDRDLTPEAVIELLDELVQARAEISRHRSKAFWSQAEADAQKECARILARALENSQELLEIAEFERDHWVSIVKKMNRELKRTV